MEGKLSAIAPNIINAGLVDDIDKAFEAGKLFKQHDVGIIFLYVTTYALSSTVLPVVRRAKVPDTNSRYKFSIGAKKFVNDWNSHGPAHHCAVGVGHINTKIEK